MLDFCLDHLKQTFSFKKSLVRSLQVIQKAGSPCPGSRNDQRPRLSECCHSPKPLAA